MQSAFECFQYAARREAQTCVANNKVLLEAATHSRALGQQTKATASPPPLVEICPPSRVAFDSSQGVVPLLGGRSA